MAFYINDKKNGKGGNSAKNNLQNGSKFITKPSTKTSSTTTKKPIKTGGTRGS